MDSNRDSRVSQASVSGQDEAEAVMDGASRSLIGQHDGQAEAGDVRASLASGRDGQTIDARASAMCDLRAEGYSLQEIADEFGLTRERVRQIIISQGGPGRAEAAAARVRRIEAQQRELRQRALALATDQPGLTIEEAADVLGAGAVDLRRTLGADARRLFISHHPGAPIVFTDDELLEHIRKAAAAGDGRLTVRRYDEVKTVFSGGSTALILQRFGTWRAACAMAGVDHGRPVRDNFERRWSWEQLIAAVADYLSGPSARGSFADYESWARARDDQPSGQTVRSQIGSWSQAKAQALRMLARQRRRADERDV